MVPELGSKKAEDVLRVCVAVADISQENNIQGCHGWFFMRGRGRASCRRFIASSVTDCLRFAR